MIKCNLTTLKSTIFQMLPTATTSTTATTITERTTKTLATSAKASNETRVVA